ncbi:helix-turn-helix domain-containing protein [Egicoccus halophilus]|uniref:helix-turn-helix domain-containing protein n=1 Tax=Egicoccus halophilus TaxID=1670830 RepID=UPI00103049D7
MIGDRLRDIRHQQGLSLADVEVRSDGRWKAVVVGAYERGDRAVTISRLAELAGFYGVPIASLLPSRPVSSPRTAGHRRREADTGRTPVTLDLRRLDDLGRGSDEPDDADDRAALHAVARFAGHIAQLRGDHNGRVLTVRGDDLRTVAVAAGADPDALLASLRASGAVLSP